jgi:hypothetical protein
MFNQINIQKVVTIVKESDNDKKIPIIITYWLT